MKTVFKDNVVTLFEGERQVGNVILGKQSETTYRVLRVFVVEDKRNLGLAKFLMQETVKYAQMNNFKLLPVCSYATMFFMRHKEFDDIVFKP